MSHARQWPHGYKERMMFCSMILLLNWRTLGCFPVAESRCMLSCVLTASYQGIPHCSHIHPHFCFQLERNQRLQQGVTCDAAPGRRIAGYITEHTWITSLLGWNWCIDHNQAHCRTSTIVVDEYCFFHSLAALHVSSHVQRRVVMRYPSSGKIQLSHCTVSSI